MTSQDQKKELVEAAIGYATAGWQVFPCHPTGHQPLVEHGFYGATADVEKIRGWWWRWPDAAVALRTGQESGVFAVDVDPRNGGGYSLEHLEGQQGPLPETVESQTGGGGRHLLFRWPGTRVPCSTGKVAPGIDVKGDGGYIILPPSDHKSAKRYCWMIGQEPGEHTLADAPAWLMNMIMRPEEPAPGPEGLAAALHDAIPEGYRNKTLASIAGHLRRIGMQVEEIKAALLAVNGHRCTPPLEAAEVERIARSIGRYDPDSAAQAQVEQWPERYLGTQGAGASPMGPVMTCLADVKPRNVEWLWPKRIAIGKITMLAGDPGLGKSFCSMDIAARVSVGAAWPDLLEAPQQVGSVIILSAEDALDDTIRPRLDAAGADSNRICAIEAIREFDPATGKPRQRGFCLDKDIHNLEHAIRQMGDCRLVVIDPISAYLGEANSHNNAEVRALLSPLADLATRYRVAVLCVSHLNKGNGDAMYRVMGSLAFVAAARAGYAVVKDRQDETGQRRFILPIKNNLGDDESGLAYRIAEVPGLDQPRVEWEPNLVHMTVNDALGVGDGEGGGDGQDDEHQRRKTQVAEAVQWLEGFLNDGPKSASDIIEAARKNGIKQRTLERAKTVLGAVARREGFAEGSRWVWQKVDISALVPPAEVAAFDE